MLKYDPVGTSRPSLPPPIQVSSREQWRQLCEENEETRRICREGKKQRNRKFGDARGYHGITDIGPRIFKLAGADKVSGCSAEEGPVPRAKARKMRPGKSTIEAARTFPTSIRLQSGPFQPRKSTQRIKKPRPWSYPLHVSVAIENKRELVNGEHDITALMGNFREQSAIPIQQNTVQYMSAKEYQPMGGDVLKENE